MIASHPATGLIFYMGKSHQRHLIVDGYNVIHEVSSLNKILKESQEAACESLIHMARTIHDEEDALRVTVVFDGREERLQLERPCQRITFSVIYAPRQLSADGVIEQLLSRAEDPSLLTVATRDHMIREAAASRGGFSISGDEFETWVARCERQTQRRIRPSISKKDTGWKSPLADLLDETKLNLDEDDER